MKISNPKVLALVVSVTLMPDAWRQHQFDTGSEEESDHLLVRLQRIKDGELSCPLLRRDGTFHLAYTNNDNVDLRAGTLSEVACSELQTLLANQSLAAMSQEKIHEPPMSQERHAELALNLLRLPGSVGWQNLHFRTSESQQDFKAEISSFVRWLDFLRKEPRNSLTEEEGRNTAVWERSS